MGFRTPASSWGIRAGLPGEAESRGPRTQAVAAASPPLASGSSAGSKGGGLILGRSHSSSFSRPLFIYFFLPFPLCGMGFGVPGASGSFSSPGLEVGPRPGDRARSYRVRNSGLLRAEAESVSHACVDVCVCWGKAVLDLLSHPGSGPAKMPARPSRLLGGPVLSPEGDCARPLPPIFFPLWRPCPVVLSPELAG